MTKHPYTAEIIDAYYQLLALDSDADKEKCWMAAHLSFVWPCLNTLQLHVLVYIAKHPDTNGKSIGRAMGLLPGTLSKITNRLRDAQLISIEPEHGDRRGRVYRGTARGNEVCDVHDRMHRIKDSRIEEMLSAFSIDERRLLSRFLNDLLRIETLND
ncbi:MAG: MarR family transcriptional regulator [Sporolactobacillus sp.]